MRRVLFVDDEQAVLHSLDRLFGSEFEVRLAESGQAALGMLNEGYRAPVLVTDMRMPQMDGVEFSKAAQQVAPEAKVLMLTGNQDLGAATAAVNDGGVFRFYNKPCPPETLREGIDAAMRQYDIDQAEKTLLRKTLLGAISSISRVAERASEDIASRIADYGPLVSQLAELAEVPARWEYPVACRLALIGLPGTPADSQASLWRGFDPVAENRDAFKAALEEAAAMIKDIPRLDTVSEILRKFPDADGSLCSRKPKKPGAIAEVGAALLRVTVATQYSRSHGLSVEHTASEVRALLPSIDDALYTALQALEETPPQQEVMMAPADQVQVGMVLSQDLCGPSGELLMRSGRRLNAANIDRLREHAASDVNPPEACVTATSFTAFNTDDED